MLKKFFLLVLSVMLLVALTKITINVYKNNPDRILRILKKQIGETKSSEFKSHNDWLWHVERTFIFDVIYMNIFSPGMAKIHITSESSFKGTPVFILEAVMEPNEFFKKLYEAKMVITSAVQKKSKLSMWYQDVSVTPEKKKTKEIIFDLRRGIAIREGKKYKIPDNTYDPLSVFFNFLDKDFKIGKPIILKLLSKEEIYEFKVVPVELKDDIYKLKGEVFRQDRSSTHGASFTFWVLNGNIRVPLIIKINSAGGPVYLRLKSVK